MKKLVSLLCAVAMLSGFAATTCSAAFVENSQPKIIAEYTNVAKSGVAEVSVYLDWGVYDFAPLEANGKEWEDIDGFGDMMPYYDGKLIRTIEVHIDTTGYSPTNTSTVAILAGCNMKYEAAENQVNYLMNAQNVNELFSMSEKITLGKFRIKFADASEFSSVDDAAKRIEIANKGAAYKLDINSAKICTMTFVDAQYNDDMGLGTAYMYGNLDTVPVAYQFGAAGEEQAAPVVAKNADGTDADPATGIAGAAATGGFVWPSITFDSKATGAVANLIFTDNAQETFTASLDFTDVEGDANITAGIILKTAHTGVTLKIEVPEN